MGDAVAAAALFAPDGRMLTADRTEVSGRAAIEGVLTQLVQSRIGLEIRLGKTLRAGEIALSTQYWRRRSPIGREGDGFDQSTVANVVLGLRDQSWKRLVPASRVALRTHSAPRPEPADLGAASALEQLL